jgi:hypothetical protein
MCIGDLRKPAVAETPQRPQHRGTVVLLVNSSLLQLRRSA